MDVEADDIREELRIQRKLLEDTNKMVHKMHRGAVWGRLLSWVWWGVVLLVTGSIYYYFLLPYVSQVSGMWEQVQQFWSQYRM